MKALVRARDVNKVFALAEHGGPVSLLAALRAAKRETTHREVHALHDVSFEIREGERVGIIGRNGAGKTTLLSILSGITAPTTGELEIRGDVHAMLTIGAVLRDDLTGRENIRLDGAIHGKSSEEIESHISEIIAFSELDEFIDRPVLTYSSGMKARLAFSMGAFVNPDVLIIDETLSVGDVFFSEKAEKRMKEITRQGRIVIVVSHSLAFIDNTCNRCLWLDQGKLVLDGPPADVTRAYQAAVEQADEIELTAKFGAGEKVSERPDAGRLHSVALEQERHPLAATARAFVPLQAIIHGAIGNLARSADIRLSILRVDGRRIMSQRLSEAGEALPQQGLFTASVAFDPLILGAGLYRFEVTLMDADGSIDTAYRVVEIIDEEGQFGGVPLLFCPPIISAKPLGHTS